MGNTNITVEFDCNEARFLYGVRLTITPDCPYELDKVKFERVYVFQKQLCVEFLYESAYLQAVNPSWLLVTEFSGEKGYYCWRLEGLCLEQNCATCKIITD